MIYNKVQQVSIVDVDNKPVYWTKGKQKPANRYTYFEDITFRLTGSKKDIGGTYDERWAKFCKSYNAGREITIVIIRHMYKIVRNSSELGYTDSRKEVFTVDRKHRPLTSDQYKWLIDKFIAVQNQCWKQENR